MTRWAWIAVLLGLGLRLMATTAHELPRGDVVLDVGVARSLVQGSGFASGFTRGVVAVAADEAPPPQGHADQHPPLWPLLGALLTPLAGSPFAALRLLSLLSGVALLLLVMRVMDRLTDRLADVPEGLPVFAAGLLALGFLPIDAAGNGSLYGAQALLVLALVESLARPRLGLALPGLLLGALILLNHQTLVLLPLPLLVYGAGVPPCQRRRALLLGAGAMALALLCQVPWWWRNALVFGDPLHSVNGLYLSYWTGAPVRFVVEDGLALQRVERGLGAITVARALLGFARMNGMYLLVAGLAVVPGLLGLALAGAPAMLRRGVQGCDRRRLALVLASAALLLVSLLWPATKLRYLVSLAPLLVLLGLDAWLHPVGRWGRAGALLLALAWLVALAASAGDAFATDGGARPLRCAWLLFGGGLLFVAPLLAWLRGVDLRRGTALTSGWPLCALLALAVPLGPPLRSGIERVAGPAAGDPTGTAYHGTWFLPDAFGQDAEGRDGARGVLLSHVREQALAEGLGTLAGPIELLAWPQPALVELPTLDAVSLRGALGTLLDARRVDGVVLVDGTDDALRALQDDGRLVLRGHWANALASAHLFVVVRS